VGGVKFTRPRDGPVAPPTARVRSSAAAAMAARGRALIAWAAECFLGKENREEDLALAVGEASERARGSGSTPGQAKAPRGEGEHPPPPRSGRVRLGGSHRTAASLSVPPASFSSPAAAGFYHPLPHTARRGDRLISPGFFYSTALAHVLRAGPRLLTVLRRLRTCNSSAPQTPVAHHAGVSCRSRFEASGYRIGYGL